MYASNGARLGAWYNNWDDFKGDIGTAIDWARRIPRDAANTAGNVLTNVDHITQPQIPYSTLLYAGIGLGAFMLFRDYLDNGRRRNPRGRRRKRNPISLLTYTRKPKHTTNPRRRRRR